jgi:Variant SH3 domain
MTRQKIKILCQGENPCRLLTLILKYPFRFVPRHEDEIEIDIGDPVYVQKEADDLWCEGESHW